MSDDETIANQMDNLNNEQRVELIRAYKLDISKKAREEGFENAKEESIRVIHRFQESLNLMGIPLDFRPIKFDIRELKSGGVESSKEDKTDGLIEGVQNSPTPYEGTHTCDGRCLKRVKKK